MKLSDLAKFTSCCGSVSRKQYEIICICSSREWLGEGVRLMNKEKWREWSSKPGEEMEWRELGRSVLLFT